MGLSAEENFGLRSALLNVRGLVVLLVLTQWRLIDGSLTAHRRRLEALQTERGADPIIVSNSTNRTVVARVRPHWTDVVCEQRGRTRTKQT